MSSLIDRCGDPGDDETRWYIEKRGTENTQKYVFLVARYESYC